MSIVDRIIWICLGAIAVLIVLWTLVYGTVAHATDDEYWRDWRRDSERQACEERWTPELRDDCLRQLREKDHRRGGRRR